MKNIVEASRFCESVEELIKDFPEYVKQFGLDIQDLKLQITKEKLNIHNRIIEVIKKEGECFIEYKGNKTVYVRLYNLNKTSCYFELLVEEYKPDRKLILLSNKFGSGYITIGEKNDSKSSIVMDMIYTGTIISKPY
jgi:hypothetical protein